MPFVPSLSPVCRSLREAQRIRMSERRLLGEGVGPKWQAATG